MGIGDMFYVFLNKEGRVFTMGDNLKGQLGFDCQY